MQRDLDLRMQIRLDAQPRRTSQGYPIVTIAAARTGLQTYFDAQYPGGQRVEFRSFEDVTEAESLASWLDAPLTIYHPKEGAVTLRNSPELKRGYIRRLPWVERNEADGEDYLLVEAIIDHPELADAILAGRLVEVSAGYDCLFLAAPGEYKGVKYDGRQTQIRINHLSFLPPGMARAGQHARVRLDGERSCIYFSPDHEGVYTMSEKTLVRLKLDANQSLDLEPETADKVQRVLDAHQTRIDALESEVATLESAKQELQGKVDGLTASNEKLQSDLAAAQDLKPDLMPVLQAVSKVNAAGAEIDPMKLDEATPAGVYRQGLKQIFPDKDFSDKTETYMSGVVDGLQSKPSQTGDGNLSPEGRRLRDSLKAPKPPATPTDKPAPRADGKDVYTNRLSAHTQKILGGKE